ncbi:hypothetical protein D3C78_769220 [compost metagenome]
MQPRQGATATGFAQLDSAYRTTAHQCFTQLDHTIDHRVFRTAFLQSRAGQKQHRAAGKSRMTLQRGDEFLGVQRRFSTRLGCQQAIDDQQRRLVMTDFAAQQLDHLIQPLALQGIESADELDLCTDHAGIEETQGCQVLEQTLMRLAQQGGDQYPSALSDMIERQLIGQNGFSRPRPPLNDIGSADDQTALEQCVKPFDAAGKAFK